MFDFLKKNPVSEFFKNNRLSKAFEAARDAEAKGLWGKARAFLKTFLGILEIEKEKTKDEAEASVKKSTDKIISKAKAAFKIPENAKKDQVEAFDEAVAVAISCMEAVSQYEDGDSEVMQEVVDELYKVIEDRKVPEFSDEKKASHFTFLGIRTLYGLKEHAEEVAKKTDKDAEDVLLELLENMNEVTSSSNYPICRLFSDSVRSVFKFAIDNPSDFFKNFGIDNPDEVVPILQDLKNDPMQNEEAVEDFLGEKVFTNTNSDDLQDIAGLLNKFVSRTDSEITPEELCEFVFLVDTEDYEKLSTLLLGKRVDSLKQES